MGGTLFRLHWSWSALATSIRVIRPWSTSTSPSRWPVALWSRSATAICSELTRPFARKRSPILVSCVRLIPHRVLRDDRPRSSGADRGGRFPPHRNRPRYLPAPAASEHAHRVSSLRGGSSITRGVVHRVGSLPSTEAFAACPRVTMRRLRGRRSHAPATVEAGGAAAPRLQSLFLCLARPGRRGELQVRARESAGRPATPASHPQHRRPLSRESPKRRPFPGRQGATAR